MMKSNKNGKFNFFNFLTGLIMLIFLALVSVFVIKFLIRENRKNNYWQQTKETPHVFMSDWDFLEICLKSKIADRWIEYKGFSLNAYYYIQFDDGRYVRIPEKSFKKVSKGDKCNPEILEEKW